MRNKLILTLGGLIICLGYMYAQTEKRLHEYRINNHYEPRVTVRSSNAIQKYQTDVSELHEGIINFTPRTLETKDEFEARTQNLVSSRQADADGWINIGKAIFFDGLFNKGECEVDVEQNKTNPSEYRLLNAWSHIIGSETEALYIDTTNPNCVNIPLQPTGIAMDDYGTTDVCSTSVYLMSQGLTEEEVIELYPEVCITIKEGLIHIPKNAFLVMFPESTQYTEAYTFNDSKDSYITLPQWSEALEGVIFDGFFETTFLGFEPKEVPVLIQKNNWKEGVYRLIDPWELLIEEPYGGELIIEASNPKCVIIPMQSSAISTGSVEQGGRGLTYLFSFSEYYESVEEFLESEDAAFNITLDEETRTINFPCVQMTFSDGTQEYISPVLTYWPDYNQNSPYYNLAVATKESPSICGYIKLPDFGNKSSVVVDQPETLSPLAGYEYWLDDDYAHKIFVASSNDINNIEVSVDGLTTGTHYFNFREVNADGKWGAMSRSAFFMRESDTDLIETLSPLAGYEYWLDDDYVNRVYKASSSSNIVASLPLDDLKPGIHFFNFRSHNEAGRWGAMTRNVFYLHESDLAPDEGAKIIGYRYKFNDKSTYVAIEPCSEYSLNNKIINIPSYEEFASLDEGCKFEFTPTNIKLTREINSVFSLQFENENHEWSVPAALEICDKDTLNRATVELKPQNSVTLDKVPSGDFNALRLEITESNNYYFKATQPCRIDLYKEDGKLYQTLESRQLVKLCEAGLLEGTYYGIVRDHVTNDEYPEQSVTIRMLLTEGFTPEPVISFADSTLTITAMEGAKIYYTLDGSNPTSESTVYTEPIKVLQNCTVKAIAHHPDLAVSDVSTYKIDTYIVATPEVLFTNLKVYMSCSTPEAKLYYTVNGTDPRTNGTLYTEPVTINYNCTVKVVGKREDYNDSDVLDYMLDVENIRCTPPIFTREGNILTLSSLTDDVTFYYTLDGNSSNPSYEIYDRSITLSHNGIVKAYCVKEGYLNSETVSYTVDWFQTATPEFDIVDNKIVMLCSTEGAEIYYTVDGTTPDNNSAKYVQPVPMTQGMVVKAIAYALNFNPSEVVTFDAENLRCGTPTFTADRDKLTISTTTTGGSIYYTLDGSEPTIAATLYDAPITLTQNCEVKAFAVKEGRADSHTASYVVDWFQTETPKFALDDHILSITCNTPNAEIYYTIGGTTPDKTANKYTEPIELTDNKIVKAIAYAEHFNDSEMSEFKPDIFICEAVQVKYDGRYVSLECSTPGATIYYTTDGTTPSTSSQVYINAFDVNGLSTIKAIAVKPNFKDSETSVFATEYYFDGSTAMTSRAGLLKNAIENYSNESITSLNVTGQINGDDIALIKALPALSHLNLEDADVEGNVMYANSFAGSPIVSISMPRTIENVGSGIFAGCPNLAAIQWNASRTLPSSALSGFSNPNLLLYVKINSHAPSNVTNVVSSGYANTITLHDGEGNTNFYCPQEFTAKHIEYRHNYTQETVKKACAGWETLSLPFDVQAIKHATKGALTPFASHDPEAKPFWLCTLGAYGFVDAAEIKANTPYIISMPNNMEYADDYILDGEVTFSADNITIPATSIHIANKNEFMFSPTTINVAKSQNVYALNVGETYEGFMPGATFVSDLRDVRPFEAYLTTEMRTAPRMISVEGLGFEDEASLYGIELAPSFAVRGEYGRIVVISDRAINVNVYSSLGALVWSEEVSVGESYINNLPAGIYFVNGQKVVVR